MLVTKPQCNVFALALPAAGLVRPTHLLSRMLAEKGFSGMQVEQQEAKHTHCQPGVVSLIIRDAKKRCTRFSSHLMLHSL